MYHPLAADMGGQAAKGLGTDNILIAMDNQLHHFSGKKPALAHAVAQADQLLHGGLGLLVCRELDKV